MSDLNSGYANFLDRSKAVLGTNKPTILTKGDVLYICDRRACERCHPYCQHTRDITHAENFELFCFVDGAFIEKDNGDTV